MPYTKSQEKLGRGISESIFSCDNNNPWGLEHQLVYGLSASVTFTDTNKNYLLGAPIHPTIGISTMLWILRHSHLNLASFPPYVSYVKCIFSASSATLLLAFAVLDGHWRCLNYTCPRNIGHIQPKILWWIYFKCQVVVSSAWFPTRIPIPSEVMNAL